MSAFRKALLYVAAYASLTLFCFLLIFTQNSDNLVETSEGRLSYLLTSALNGLVISTVISLIALTSWSWVITPWLSGVKRRGKGYDAEFWRGFGGRLFVFIVLPAIMWLSANGQIILMDILKPLAFGLVGWLLLIEPLKEGVKSRGNGLDAEFWREFWWKVRTLFVVVVLGLLASVSVLLAVAVTVVVLIVAGYYVAALHEDDRLGKSRDRWRNREQ